MGVVDVSGTEVTVVSPVRDSGGEYDIGTVVSGSEQDAVVCLLLETTKTKSISGQSKGSH